MCNACGFLCCAYDAFSGCGCDFCSNSDCWDNEDFDYRDFDGVRARGASFFCDSPIISETPERKITASPRQSIAVVGTDGAASARASLPSYLRAHGDPASVQGGEQGRLFARTTGDNSIFDQRAA